MALSTQEFERLKAQLLAKKTGGDVLSIPNSNNPVTSALKGETSFPADVNTSNPLGNIARTGGNIPSSTAKLVRGVISPVNPLDTESPLNIGANAVKSTSALHDIYKDRGVAQGTKDILGGFADTYLKIGETIYGGLDKAYNALLDNPKKAIADATEHLAKIGIEDPMLIPTLLYGGGKTGAGKTDLITKVSSPVTRGADTSVANIAEKTITPVVDLSKRATTKIIEATKPVPKTPIQAVGQVIQGETKDIGAGVKSLSSLDTEGVKTYQELNTKINSKITELAEKVDADLGLDTTKRPLKSLNITEKTTSGKPVTITPVKNSLEQLNELYTKTGDIVNSANIKELIKTASENGLTNQEINDIARIYGKEFGTKAFSKMGEPLTSVNAQMYENTRKSLKILARQGIKGAEAKIADQTMSSLYNTQKLVEKNIEAVNKLMQKINERGLFEKVGHTVSKYADVLTGGSVRGFIGGLLPRGAGYKVLNALDVEKALANNLKIIREAIAGKGDNEIVKILEALKPK